MHVPGLITIFLVGYWLFAGLGIFYQSNIRSWCHLLLHNLLDNIRVCPTQSFPDGSNQVLSYVFCLLTSKAFEILHAAFSLHWVSFIYDMFLFVLLLAWFDSKSSPLWKVIWAWISIIYGGDMFFQSDLAFQVQVKSSWALLSSATCVDIQWNEMSYLTGPRCYNTDIYNTK